MDILTWIEKRLPAAADIAIHIVLAIVIYFIGKKLIHYLIRFLKKSFGRSNMEEGVADFLLSIIKFASYFLLIILICQFLGLETSSAVAVLGSAGLTLGLALQGSLANFAGGVLILIMKPFVVGDYIVVGELEGTVVNIDIIYTKLQMVDNKTVILPNGKLADSDIVNVTNQHMRRIDIVVGVDYGENIGRVREVLLEIIKSQEGILQGEPMDVVVNELNSSSVDMAVHVWVEKEDYWRVRWALLEKIKVRFDETGIMIPYNHLDVTLKQ